MKSIFLVVVFSILLFAPAQGAIAQSPEMPLPALVLVDADGKPMAQVVNVDVSHPSPGWGTTVQVTVVFNFDNNLAAFSFNPSGDGRTIDADLLLRFPSGDCTGQPHLPRDRSFNYFTTERTAYVILGPDSADGTYRVYRTTQGSSTEYFNSYLDARGENCIYDNQSGQSTLYIAEEVIPNPLEGFLGPTDANPERVLTIEGGTRLP